MARQLWPTGIRPSGNGIRIRVWSKGALVYDETVPGDPNNPRDLARAVKLRERLTSRLLLGLPIQPEATGNKADFGQAAQAYLDQLDAKHSTQLSYENIINRYWLPEFSGWPLQDVTTKQVKRVLSGLKVSNKTKKNVLIPLRGVFAHAEVQPNPAAGVTFRKSQTAAIDRYLPDERTRLLQQLHGEARVYFGLLFGCGLRPGEALALLWTDFNGTELSVSKQITRRRLEASTKTSVRRTVFVPTWAREILNAHTTRFHGGHILLNSFNRPHLDTDVFNGAWKTAHKKLRIPYRIPYVCRHSRAAELLSIGIEPGDAARQLGHSLEMFLRIYSEWIEEYSTAKDKSRFEGVGLTSEKSRMK
jgi:integrase